MPEVTINDLLVLNGTGGAGGPGVDADSQTAVFNYSDDPAASDFGDVLDGVTFATPDGTPGEDIPLGSTTTIDGTDYELTEAYSFWGAITKTDPDTGETFTDSGQTMALTLTSGTGEEINIVSPADSFTSDPEQWSPGQVIGVEVASEPFSTDAIYETDGSNKLGGDDPFEPPCFVAGTLIDTADGPKPVEDVGTGEMVLTRDNGYQPISWAGARHMTLRELQTQPDFAPVRIAAGALGGGLPERAMHVSPWHRILVCAQRAELMFGEYEVLVPALHLVGQPGITRDMRAVTYVHLMFADHQIVRGDGAWSESFQPGAKTLGGMDPEQRAELLALFPQLAGHAGQKSYTAARLSLKPHEARALLSA